MKIEAKWPVDRWTRVADSATESWAGAPLKDTDGKVIGKIIGSRVEDDGRTIVIETELLDTATVDDVTSPRT
jgi:hypothetical protein